MKRVGSLGLVVALAVTMAACGSDDNTSSATDAPAASAAPATDAPTASAAPSTDAPTASAAPDTEPVTTEAGASGPATGEPLKVGFANITIGSLNLDGFNDGAEAVTKYINTELNGINGRPIELVRCDVDGSAETNQACGQQFANDGDIDVVATGILTNGASFYSALNATKTPIYGGIPVSDADNLATGVNFFVGGSAISGRGVGALAKVVVPDIKKMFVIYEDNAAGTLSRDALLAGLGDGVEVETAAVPSSAGDVLPIISSAVNSGAEMIGIVSTLDNCKSFVKAFDSLGGSPVPLATNAQCVNATVAAEGSIEGWYLSTDRAQNSLPPGANADVDAFLATYPKYSTGVDAKKSFVLEGWDILLGLRSALSSIDGDMNDENIAAAIAAFTGPVPMGAKTVKCPGPTNFPANCATGNALVYQWKDGGLTPFGGGFIKLTI